MTTALIAVSTLIGGMKMTEIKSAIEHLDSLLGMIEDNQNTDYDSDFKLAIRSLQAWGEVLQELKTEKNKSYENGGFNYLGLQRAINVINQHLAEIEE